MAKKYHLIEYQVSPDDIRAHNPDHLVFLFQTLSLAKGKALAALQGCFNIILADGFSAQSFNHPDVRAYCLQLIQKPLGLSYFLRPDSQSLEWVAFAVAPKISTVEVKVSSRSSNLGVQCESADLVGFLTPDLALSEKLFSRAGLPQKDFEACARHVSKKFNLKSEDWD